MPSDYIRRLVATELGAAKAASDLPRPLALAGASQPRDLLEVHIQSSVADGVHVPATEVSFLGLPFVAYDCLESVTFEGQSVARQCVLKAFVCHWLIALLGAKTTLAQVEQVASAGYTALRGHAATALVRAGPIPATASMREWHCRQTLARFVLGGDQAIDLTMVLGLEPESEASSWQPTPWRFARFIVINVNKDQHLSVDVFDGPDFGASDESYVAFFLLFEHHLRPLVPLRQARAYLDAARWPRSDFFLNRVRLCDSRSQVAFPLSHAIAYGWAAVFGDNTSWDDSPQISAAAMGYVPRGSLSPLPVSAALGSAPLAFGTGGARLSTWRDTLFSHELPDIVDFANVYLGALDACDHDLASPRFGLPESSLAEPWRRFTLADIQEAVLTPA